MVYTVRFTSLRFAHLLLILSASREPQAPNTRPSATPPRISVGKCTYRYIRVKPVSYTHLDVYKRQVYRTDLQGTITIGSDGQNYTVGTEHFAADSALNPTDPAASSTAQQAYIGNVNSKKFHLPTCPNLPAEKNQILFSSYQEAVEAGYTPCSSCIK